MSKPNNAKKLTVEDVVQIKRLLREGKLTQLQVGEQFGVNRRAIGNINLGKSYSDIQIDDNGNLIDEKADDKKFQQIVEGVKSRTGNLKAEDVAGIKYILLKSYMSESEIAELFDVDRKTINNISNGRTWKQVELDSDGNYIEPVKIEPIKPEPKVKSIMSIEPVDEYEVPRFERVEEVEPVVEVKLTEEEQDVVRQKRIFLDGLWEMKPTWKTWKSKKYRSTRITSTNDFFNKKLHNDWSKKYQPWGRLNLEEYMAQAAWLTQDAVLKMEIENRAFTWEKVNAGDDSSLNILFDNINKVIATGMSHHSNWMQERQRAQRSEMIDGKKTIFYEYTGIDADSTEKVMKNSEGEERRLINMLDNDSNFYGSVDDERLDDFIEFFEEKKRYFLTQSQYNNWETLVATEFIPGGAGYTENDRTTVYGIDRSEAGGIRKTVKNRAIKAYQEVNPDALKDDSEVKVSRLKQRTDAEIQLLEKFIAIIDEEEIELRDMNRKLSEFILRRLDGNPFIFDLINDNLTGFDLMNVTDGLKSGEIASETLYKIVEMIEAKIVKLKKFNTTVKPFKRKSDEYVMSGQVVDVEKYREIQAQRNPKKEKGKRKKHTSLRLMNTGSTFELDGEK